MAAFRKWAKSHVELVNHALAGIPEEKVRYHICWGSWKGPHSTDLPLRNVIDLMLKVKASQYSVEAANPQHEHEWKDWKDVKLPAGKAVIPGVVTHKTNVLEHPEVVADRIVRYAEAVGPGKRYRRHGLRHGRPHPSAGGLGKATRTVRRCRAGEQAAVDANDLFGVDPRRCTSNECGFLPGP